MFVDRATFEAHRDAGGFLEWAEFLGHLYGTPLGGRPPSGADVVLLEIEVQGARQVRERIPDALLVFLDAPSREDQAARMRARGDAEEDVRRRLAEAETESRVADELGMVRLVNDSVEGAVDALGRVIGEARARRGTDSG
ncbi:MAG: hypothetical protein U5R31_10410 [Acidimicrobiia bacterium]|nr:hypothetical protein [Acidimicrobiia bacterium]